MLATQLISAKEAKQRLATLRDARHIALDPIIYDFADHLERTINQQITPMGFVLFCELALVDLEHGVKHPRLSDSLNKITSATYQVLHDAVPSIAAAVFPEEFSEAVSSYTEQVRDLTL